jgi:hypothetical protein
MMRLARLVTPAQATLLVALVAVAALAASQFVDYRAVEIGAHRWGVGGLAAAPQLAAERPRSAHGEWILAICGVALALVAAAAILRRPALGRLLVLLGAIAIIVALVVDRPHALAVGHAGVAYQGARAVLMDGFGAEIAAAATLAFAGFMLPLQPGAALPSRQRRARPGRPSPPVEQAPQRTPLEPREAGG